MIGKILLSVAAAMLVFGCAYDLVTNVAVFNVAMGTIAVIFMVVVAVVQFIWPVVAVFWVIYWLSKAFDSYVDERNEAYRKIVREEMHHDHY